MISTELVQDVSVCTTECATSVCINHETDENSSEPVNTEASARTYVVPHPHETSSEYNLRVQWQRAGKFVNVI